MELNLKKENYFLVFIIFLFVLIKFFFFLSFQSKFWWDEVVYLSIAKYFFSFGHLGFYDGLRPILFSLTIGFFSLCGIFNEILVGKILIVICGVISLILIHKISNKIFPNSGDLSISIFFSTFLFFFSTNFIFTEIFSLSLLLFSVYLILNQKYYFSGLFVGLAFESRFFLGIYLPLIGFFILIKLINFKSFKINTLIVNNLFLIKKSFNYVLGFISIVIPYLIFNYLYFGNFLEPIIRGSQIISQNSLFLFKLDYLYYFKVLFENSFILFFTICFVIYYFYNKKIRKNKNYLLLFLLTIIPLIYLSLGLHKEDRYIFSILPFMSILSSVFIILIINKIKMKFKIFKKINLKNVSIFLFLIISIHTLFLFNSFSSTYSDQELNFYHFFDDKHNLNIITTDITFSMFSDNNFYPLSSWDLFSDVAFKKAKGDVDYVIVNNYNIYCEYSQECDEKYKLEDYLNTQELVFHEENVKINWNTFVNLSIYKINSLENFNKNE